MSMRHRDVLCRRRMMGKNRRYATYLLAVRLFVIAVIGLGALLHVRPVHSTAASSTTAPNQEIIHVVQAGESLGHIANQYGVELQELITYNNVDDWNHIVVGQRITIPAPTPEVQPQPSVNPAILPGDNGYYTVQAGDRLAWIAGDFGLAVEEILLLNGVDNPNAIYVGQELRVSARVAPSRSAVGAPVSTPKLADTVHIVRAGEALAQIARQHNTTVQHLMLLNGLPNENFVYVGQRLRLQEAPPFNEIMSIAGAPADGARRIEIDLSEQKLIAWQGDVAVLETYVSTGKAATPTVTGSYAINLKYDSQHMTGDDFDLPGVPWVMYFFEDYAIHGAYWHTNFGQPVSHGCVNVGLHEAEALFDWASLGTTVEVHE